jgi:hypothetical protein
MYKNQIQPEHKRVASSLNYNKVPFHNRKEAEYEKNLEKFYPKNDPSPSPRKGQNNNMKAPGTKAIIEISNRGVRTNEKII